MKKYLAFLLALVLITVCGAALAYDDEITWQGLPWGSSADEVVQFLMEKGFIETEPNINSGFFPECYTFLTDKGKEAIPGRDYDKEYWDACASISIYSDSFQVGGYEVEDISFNFASDGETEKLISVVVRNRSWDAASQKDLKNKINEVYGEKWTGANDTGLCFVEQGGVWGNNYLVYSRTDALKTLKEAFENRSAEPTVDPDNTNGI